MSAMEALAFKHLEIDSHLYIKPVPATEKVPKNALVYLIMGPTGAGKSTFIEALSGKSQTLHISRDQLTGFTQTVAAYHLMNVLNLSLPIYLVDTPGFSDTKISEQEIMDMVFVWMGRNEISYFDQIFYLTPISEPRLAGSKRRTIEMLKAFLRPSLDLGSIVFVTTMWDRLYSAQSHQRAVANFAQLRDEILKEFIDSSAKITWFTNTWNSALHILDLSYVNNRAHFETSASPASAHLHHDLHDRIEGALQRKKALESDLADFDLITNPTLRSVLEQNYTENEETLIKFIGQLYSFIIIPEGYEAANKRLWNVIAAIPSLRPVKINLENPPVRRMPIPTEDGLFRRLFQATKRRRDKLFR